MLALLNLPLALPASSPARGWGMTSFADGLPEWLARCQTYEGGIAGQPGAEAHAAYAFCALAALAILGPPGRTLAAHLDLPALLAWLAARQHAPEAGFDGRTNKLVDGCYSHWVGGCWPLIEAAMNGEGAGGGGHGSGHGNGDGSGHGDGGGGGLPSFYDRDGLIRYILCCCQSEQGGLRDKPGKYPDGYHSCYVLAGLSSAQNRVIYHGVEHGPAVEDGEGPYDSAFRWSREDGRAREERRGRQVCDDFVEPIHPVFVIPFDAVQEARDMFGQARAW